jgi:hypothetical protein
MFLLCVSVSGLPIVRFLTKNRLKQLYQPWQACTWMPSLLKRLRNNGLIFLHAIGRTHSPRAQMPDLCCRGTPCSIADFLSRQRVTKQQNFRTFFLLRHAVILAIWFNSRDQICASGASMCQSFCGCSASCLPNYSYIYIIININ